MTLSTVEPRTNSPGCRIERSSSPIVDQLGQVLLVLLDVDRRGLWLRKTRK